MSALFVIGRRDKVMKGKMKISLNSVNQRQQYKPVILSMQ